MSTRPLTNCVGTTFREAAVNHDYCYHHNGAQYALDKNDCDQQFFVDITAVCLQDHLDAEHAWFSVNSCKRQAGVMYEAVRRGGDDAWDAMDAEVAYPEWTPLWETFGMDEAPALDTLEDCITG